MKQPARQGRWVIDVCRTCGRHAIWPFCEHRDMPAPAGAISWYESVAVTGRWHPAPEAPPSETMGT